MDVNEVSALTDTFTDILQKTMCNADAVVLTNFGTFEPRYRAERITVQPSTGRRLLVPPRVTAAFHPGTALRRKIRDMALSAMLKNSPEYIQGIDTKNGQ